MLSLAIVLSIFAAIVIGYKAKINVGVIAIAFSYIFGCFFVGMKGKEVIALWPTSLFFFIVMSAFFYGIAVTNGTLAKFSEHMIYRFRNQAWLLPVIMFLACFIISGLGPGPTTVFAFMPAIVLNMSDRIKMNKLLAAVIIVGGGVAGGYTPISLCWQTIQQCLLTAEYTEAQVAAMLPAIARNIMVAEVLIFIVIYLLTRAWKVESPKYDAAPEGFDSKQVKTMVLIVIGLVVAVIVPVLHNIAPDSEMFTKLNAAMQPALIFAVLLFIALLLKLGDQKKALNFVPWGTIILICGTGMLVSVAKQAGAIDYLSSWIGDNMSPFMAKLVVGLIGGGMSFFSSTIGVVAPTLIPAIPNISGATGVAATALISAILAGGHFAGVSPFSTGGAMVLAGEKDEDKNQKLFVQLMVLSLGSIVFAALLTVIGIIR